MGTTVHGDGSETRRTVGKPHRQLEPFLSASLAPADHAQGSALIVSATHPLRHQVPITMMIAATAPSERLENSGCQEAEPRRSAADFTVIRLY